MKGFELKQHNFYNDQCSQASKVFGIGPINGAFKVGADWARGYLEYQPIYTLPEKHDGLLDIVVWNTIDENDGEGFYYRIENCFVDKDRWLVYHPTDSQINVDHIFVKATHWMYQPELPST